MIWTNFAGPLTLSLGILITLSATLSRAQSPGTDLGSHAPSANQSRLQDESSPPTAAQASDQPAPEPYAGPVLTEEAVESLPLSPSKSEGGPAVHDPAVNSPFPANGGFSPFMNPFVGHALLRTDYRATWFAPEPVTGQPTRLGYVQQDFSLSFPLWQCAGTDEWLATANLSNDIFQTHAILPDTRQAFPNDLWNIRFGTSYRHLFENGWIAGGAVSVGSASDKPFHSIDEMTAGVNAFLRVPQGEHNAWLFSLSYSPTSELPIPIPGVAYVWQPSEYFGANIGLPFMVMWRPTDDLTVDLSYMLLTTFHARATYRLCRPLRLYVAYATENQGYLLADRVDSNDRFYNVDQRLTAGVQYNISPRTALDFSSGYIFDHHFFEGKNITSGNNFNRIDVGDGPYVSAQFRIRW